MPGAPSSVRRQTRASSIVGIIFLSCALAVGAVGLSAPASATTLSAVPLGTAAAYSALAGASVANTGPSALSGNVGVSPGGTITGFPPGTLTGTIYRGTAEAATAHNDLTAAYNDAASRARTDTISGDLAGRTLTAGVYRSAAALSVSTMLTLDGLGNPDSVFIFQVAAAMSTAASSRIILTNGAQASRVFWQVSAAVSLGATSSFSGTLLGLEAISVGASTGIIGRVLSVNGAVSLSSNSVNPEGAVQLGTAFDFSVLAATGVVNSGSTAINADVGVSPGTSITGFPPGIIDGQTHTADAQSGQAQTDLRTAYNDITARPASQVLAANPGGQTLTAGVYSSVGSVDLRSTVTLDGQGNPNAVFILKVNGTLTSAAATRIVLANGTKPNRVFWQVTAGTTLGSASSFTGSILGSGAIVLQNGVRVTGRALSMSGSVTLNQATFSSLSPINLRTVANFSVLGGTSVDNVGSTVLNYSVGVSPGTTITGFPPGTSTNGTIHAGDQDAAQAHTDAIAAYNEALALDAATPVSGDLAGMTLRSGVYSSPAAASVSGILTLDGRNDPNGVFIFKVGAAFGTAASSQIRLINGADLNRVFWQVTGAVSLGASSEFAGTVISPAAVSIGAGVSLQGRAISLDASVSLSTNRITSPTTEAGTLTAITDGAALSSVTLNGTTTQYATGSSTSWSVSDERGTGADWSLAISATTPTSAAGTIDTTPRQLPAESLSIAPGPITAATGADPITGLTSATLRLTEQPQSLLASVGRHRGTYTFTPTFTLTIPQDAYRSNFTNAVGGSSLHPYISRITVTVY